MSMMTLELKLERVGSLSVAEVTVSGDNPLDLAVVVRGLLKAAGVEVVKLAAPEPEPEAD